MLNYLYNYIHKIIKNDVATYFQYSNSSLTLNFRRTLRTRMVIGSENIYNSLKFFYFSLKLLGLAPYAFEENSRKFRMKLLNYLQLVFFLALFIGFTSCELCNINVNRMSSGVQSELLENFWRYIFAFQHFLTSFAIIFIYLKRKNVENILNIFYRFDEHLKYLGWNFQVKHQNPYVFLAYSIIPALFMSIYVILRIKLDNSDYHYDFFATLRFVACFFINELFLMIALQFIFSVHFVNVRLTLLLQNVRYDF